MQAKLTSVNKPETKTTEGLPFGAIEKSPGVYLVVNRSTPIYLVVLANPVGGNGYAYLWCPKLPVVTSGLISGCGSTDRFLLTDDTINLSFSN